MSIVSTEIESVHGSDTGNHLVFYRCRDHLGEWHTYGPVHAAAGFDRETHKSVVAAKIAEVLAEKEAMELLA